MTEVNGQPWYRQLHYQILIAMIVGVIVIRNIIRIED